MDILSLKNPITDRCFIYKLSCFAWSDPVRAVRVKQARVEAGMIQEQIANELNTTKSVISRMENHAIDIRLSTLEKYAKAVGRHIQVALI